MTKSNLSESNVMKSIISSNNQERHRLVWIEALEKDAARVWNDLPYCYRHDKECILRALSMSPTLPPKSQFERTFPQRLRFDKQVVLGFCARDDFDRLYYERHLFVPECLTNDKDVMVAYCRKIPRSLQECSESLTNDRDVVLAAIELDGLELQYASRNLQQDREIVQAACGRDGRALEFCPPGPLRNELVNDREFMLKVLRQHGGPMLRLAPEDLRQDRQLLLEALQHGMRWRFCPARFQADRLFLLEALQRQPSLYLEMNRTTQMQRDIAYAAITSVTSTPEVINKVFIQVPELASERPVALAMVQRGDLNCMKRFLLENASPDIHDDKEIMLAAVQRDGKLFPHVSPALKRDTDIILAALLHKDEETAPEVLASVAPETLRQHPEILVRAIAVYPQRNLRLLRAHIPDELWLDRNVAKAYLIRSGRVLEVFEPLLQNDVEMALLVAEHAGPDFGLVGESLRSNYEFMKQAVGRNGRVLRYAASLELLENLDLIVRAVANHPQALHRWSHCRYSPQEIAEHVQTILQIHHVFVREFLRGIAIARPHIPPAQRSPLVMLDRGVETSQAFKQLIAEFLGVPMGSELRVLRMALRNLTLEAGAASVTDASLFAYHDTDFYRLDRFRHRQRWRIQQLRNDVQQQDDHHEAAVHQPLLLRRAGVDRHDQDDEPAPGARWGLGPPDDDDFASDEDEDDPMRRMIMLPHHHAWRRRRRLGPMFRAARLAAAAREVEEDMQQRLGRAPGGLLLARRRDALDGAAAPPVAGNDLREENVNNNNNMDDDDDDLLDFMQNWGGREADHHVRGIPDNNNGAV